MNTDDKKSYEVLRPEFVDAGAKLQLGGLYAHYKHPELPYKVTGFAVWEATDEAAVLYQPVHEANRNVCPSACCLAVGG